MIVLRFVTTVKSRRLFLPDPCEVRKEYVLSIHENTRPTNVPRLPLQPITLPSNGPKGRAQGILSERQALPNSREFGRSTIRDVYAKWATEDEEIKLLAHEASLYSGKLKPLQGDVVPNFFGLFVDRANNPTFAVLVLELCQGSFPVDVHVLYREIMLKACRIHSVGIKHGQLLNDDHIIAHRGSVRIVDFTLARRHKCANAHPTVAQGAERNDKDECAELSSLEVTYGM